MLLKKSLPYRIKLYVTANYGEPIPLVFGTTKVSGKIIWADKVKEIANSTRHKEYFPYFHNVKSTMTSTEYSYFFSFAVGICEGEIIEFSALSKLTVSPRNDVVTSPELKYVQHTT